MNNLNAGWSDILLLLRKEAEAISGEWNGDDAGYEEDRANVADNIINTVEELQEYIAEMDEYDN